MGGNSNVQEVEFEQSRIIHFFCVNCLVKSKLIASNIDNLFGPTLKRKVIHVIMVNSHHEK